MFAHEAFRHAGRRAVSLGEGQADVAIDDEGQIAVLVAEMREIMRKTRRRAGEGGHFHPVALERHGREGLIRRCQGGDDRFKRIVQLGGHAGPFLSHMLEGRRVVLHASGHPIPVSASGSYAPSPALRAVPEAPTRHGQIRPADTAYHCQ